MKAIHANEPATAVRILFPVACFLLAGSVAEADAPALVPIQGFLTDADGVPVDGKHRLDFFLYDAATDGEDLYNTTYRDVDIDNGNFVIYLGDQEGDELDLSLFRDTSDLWLEIVIDGDQIIAPRTRFGSVIYASQAQYCGDAVTFGGRAPDTFASSTDLSALTARVEALEGATLRSERGSQTVGYDQGLFGNTGTSREVSRQVTFEQAFNTAPDVLAAIEHFDNGGTAEPIRLSVSVDQVSTTGFLMRIATWNVSNIYTIRIAWMAVGH